MRHAFGVAAPLPTRAINAFTRVFDALWRVAGRGRGGGAQSRHPPTPNPSPPLRGGGEQASLGERPYKCCPHRRQPVLAGALRRTRRVSRAHSRSDAALTAMPLAYVGETNEWDRRWRRPLCGRVLRVHAEANEETVTEFLAFSTDNPSSIRNCFESRAPTRGRSAPH